MSIQTYIAKAHEKSSNIDGKLATLSLKANIPYYQFVEEFMKWHRGRNTDILYDIMYVEVRLGLGSIVPWR